MRFVLLSLAFYTCLRTDPIPLQATASIDLQTDDLIQKTIRESFGKCTVLTIAHRLHTIIDSDRIMVLEKGQLMELDTPAALLTNPNSLFTKLVEDTGPQESTRLRVIASEKLNIVVARPSSQTPAATTKERHKKKQKEAKITAQKD